MLNLLKNSISRRFRRHVFITGLLLLKPKVLIKYYKMKMSENRSPKDIEAIKEGLLARYLISCYNQVEYYNNIGTREFHEYPIIQKSDILKSPEAFQPKKNFKSKAGATGGSTGEPLKYIMSKGYSDLGLAMSYRAWGRGGYRLGDKIAILAGGSLLGKKQSLKATINNFILNYEKYSSYGMSESLMQSYADDMKKKNVKFLRGYPSSIAEFAEYVTRQKIQLNFSAIFTTGEMLWEERRRLIESAFCSEVFDNYGLNDGGISASECRRHDGFHIDVERGFLEVVDLLGRPIVGEVGRVLATSYTNYGTRFIRYDTGDLGILDPEMCPCGSPYPLLKALKGRTNDIIRINGHTIGSPMFATLMQNMNALRFQFIQKSKSKIVAVIKPNDEYTNLNEELIRNSLFSQLGEFSLEFCYQSEAFIETDANKHKLVVSLL